MDVSSLKEEIGKLKSQIVESPEELKSQMEKMRENVKNIKNSIVSREKKKPGRSAALNVFMLHRGRLTNAFLSSERNGRACGGAAEHGAECDSHRS